MRALSRKLAVAASLVGASLIAAAPASASLLQISSDPFQNPTSQHATELEPSVFASGNTLIAAFQSGRYVDGGASGIGYARSANGGRTWTKGFLPKITVFQGGGTYQRSTACSNSPVGGCVTTWIETPGSGLGSGCQRRLKTDPLWAVEN